MIAKSNKKNIYLIANMRILKRPVRLLLYYRTNNATIATSTVAIARGDALLSHNVNQCDSSPIVTNSPT